MRGVSAEVASQHVYKSRGLDRDSAKSAESRETEVAVVLLRASPEEGSSDIFGESQPNRKDENHCSQELEK